MGRDGEGIEGWRERGERKIEAGRQNVREGKRGEREREREGG
jgi:hypothetical protein